MNNSKTSPNDKTKQTLPVRIADISDLQDVLEALVHVSDKWKRLGLALGLLNPTLEKIKAEYKNDVESCKDEMLKEWLSKRDECSPSWSSLVAALKKTTVGLVHIAEKIEEEHLST